MSLLPITIILFGTFSFYNCFDIAERKHSITIKDELGIIGGHNASIKDYPYQVSILWTFTNGETQLFLCGGFIISANYILSAAHCIKGRDPTRIVVHAGSDFRTNGTVIPIVKVIAHPDFEFKLPIDNDVAIMKTVHPIDFSDVIQPVRLPAKHTPLQDNSIVTVSGWGVIALNETNHGALRAVEIPVVNFYDCWSSYGANLTRNMWCGGNFEFGGYGACYGDSGGAAVQNGVVFGIASWTDGCILPHKPDVFTDVAAPAIRDFIILHTGL